MQHPEETIPTSHYRIRVRDKNALGDFDELKASSGGKRQRWQAVGEACVPRASKLATQTSPTYCPKTTDIVIRYSKNSDPAGYESS
jgi:hypothetical protein